MSDRLRQLGIRQRNGEPIGLFSICSSHPTVLETAMHEAGKNNHELLIESTCNQVNQFGGYTGMTPAGFADYVFRLASESGLSHDRLIIGGDHLGPHVWRDEPSETAMDKACRLVSDCVSAGYNKIHLDAGMRLADDDETNPLSMEVSAQRAARLCAAAENPHSGTRLNTRLHNGWPVYVIGAEAPTPGGSLENTEHVPVTRTEDISEFMEILRKHFRQAGIENAWERVVAIVVQPGIDFGQAGIAAYNRNKALDLSRFHRHLPDRLTYEIHGTDFQPPHALEKMVKDHFPLLKTGPALTFAFREAIFALAHIEIEWLGNTRSIRLSGIRGVIDHVMRQDPEFWESHYTGDQEGLGWKRAFGYLDRIRYYWRRPEIETALENLLENLKPGIPLPLVSQYFPDAYPTVISGDLAPTPMPLIRYRIRMALRPYMHACGLSAPIT